MCKSASGIVFAIANPDVYTAARTSAAVAAPGGAAASYVIFGEAHVEDHSRRRSGQAAAAAAAAAAGVTQKQQLSPRAIFPPVNSAEPQGEENAEAATAPPVRFTLQIIPCHALWNTVGKYQ